MAQLTYKTILAVGRDCKNQSIIHLLRDGYQFWFPEQRPLFSYASNNDKVVLFYPQSSKMSDTITLIKDDDNFTCAELPVGALKFLSDSSMIKVVECKFYTAESFKECLVLFREYLLETIRKINLPDYSSINFAILWDEKLLNPIVSDAIKQAGLLSDDEKLSHSFSLSEIQGGPPPKPTPKLEFGPSSQPYTLQNPFAPVLPLSAPQQQPTPTINQQPTTSFGFNQQPLTSTLNQQPSTTPFGFNQQPSTTPFGFNQQPSTTPFGFNQQPLTSTLNQQPSTTTPFGVNQQSTTPFGVNQQSTTPFGVNQQSTTPFGVNQQPQNSFFKSTNVFGTNSTTLGNTKQNFFTQPKSGFNWSK